MSALSCCAAALCAPRAAHAVDPFEIQVYDGSADDPGVPGLELHLNTVPSGVKRVESPERAPNHQTHFTLEPSLGITPFWELGAYVQSALEGDGSFHYGGAKLRSKFVTPKGWNANWRLGVNLELSRIPAAYDRARWGGEVRPIIAFENARWILVVNPIVELAFAGPDATKGPSFAPAAMAKLKAFDSVAFGLEYYADFGPISDFDVLHEQQHYVFEAFDLLAVHDLELNAGVGEGLTQASNGFVIKAIVGYTWEAARFWSAR